MAWRIIQNASVVKNNDTGSVGVLTAPGGEVLEIAFTADITKLKTDILDNTEAIIQNTADIDKLEVKTLPSVNLTFSSTLSTIPDLAFCANQSIISVTIPYGVTSIGDSAFRLCKNLESVTISDSVISIGSSAFHNCTSLARVTVGSGVTSISTKAFSGCTSLTSITIPDGVTKISSNTFYNCESLTSITIPNSVTSISSSAFSGCTSLTNVTLGDGFNTNNLDLSSSSRYTQETILQWLNALADRTRQEQYTLTIGATNKAKLTTEQLAIATNKNWSIA